MVCICLPGYIGDADVQCSPAPTETPGCSSNNDCPDSETCLNRRCVNPCTVSNPCAHNADCRATAHRAVCSCPTGMMGNPFVSCYQEPVSLPECTSDSDCPDNRACLSEKCQDPCIVANSCAPAAICMAERHRSVCRCPQGWSGDPKIRCYKAECTSDQDCPFDKACFNGNCVDPCSVLGGGKQCGRGAECKAQLHRAQCVCPPGTQGDALVACIIGICQYNEDCADHEACDRLNRVCRPVCIDEDVCGEGAICVGRNHGPKCSCPPGTSGNPHFMCSRPQQPIEVDLECTQDADCSSGLACINNHCQNPCTVTNPCSPDQECYVQDTLPLRTVMCKCPPDTVVDQNGLCRRIVQAEPECRIDSNCLDTHRCQSGTCVEACRSSPCGVNAICRALGHQGTCSCAPGYQGNPYIECTNIPKTPPLPPPPECLTDDECPMQRACIDRECRNPCMVGEPCARTAFCHVEKHRAVCRCPDGYEGNPMTGCRPVSANTLECASHSDCTDRESCVNGICVNPCNCGPNADCRVTNHYPICLCKPGFSGNPQYGCLRVGCQVDDECSGDKQCYNGECINPCVINNPCATNAMCHSDSGTHRAECRCPVGYEGDPFTRCIRVECRTDVDCPLSRACMDHRCIDPCSGVGYRTPCASNAICLVRNHVAACRCPETMPLGDATVFCEPRPPPPTPRPECKRDIDCLGQLACIGEKCLNPCKELMPCSATSRCTVLETVPVRTMTCTCPDGWVPNVNGECRPVVLAIPPGCTSNSECSNNMTCINRMCRSPCDCGSNAACFVQDHRPICSCKEGYEGNPNIACYTVGCRSNSECDSGKACINGNCISPCLVDDPCGSNADCYSFAGRAECRCRSGYRGNPYSACHVVGCRSNGDCPDDRACIDSQCISPCVHANPCAPTAMDCIVRHHMSVCRCPPGHLGNPYVACRPEPRPECKVDGDCPRTLACISNRCAEPCRELEPCTGTARCRVVPGTVPVRTMLCICPDGYISGGSGVCRPTTPVIAGCSSDSDCAEDKSCVEGVCRNPCNCALNANCRVFDHKPVCSCKQGYEGNPEIKCVQVGCRRDDECSSQHACVNGNCEPVCKPDGRPCGTEATCRGANHRAICECLPGLAGDPYVACTAIGCRGDSECPSTRACLNGHCVNPCSEKPCAGETAICTPYDHRAVCSCPAGYIMSLKDGAELCEKIEIVGCRRDNECPSGMACIDNNCVNPCNVTEPCGVNAKCRVLDTEPVRTMLCECLPGYQGNAAVQCDKVVTCLVEKGYVKDVFGNCVCPPGSGLNDNEDCILCPTGKGLRVDERGRCVCALERGMIIDERGNCVCPQIHGYRIDTTGNCIKSDIPVGPECQNDNDCPDNQYCNETCQDPCSIKHCGINALCNATNHRAVCQCITGYTGNPEVICNGSPPLRTDFPRPDMVVSCLSDGVQVEIHITEQGFNGVLYVKGHSKDEQCRRVVTLAPDAVPRVETFKVNFGSCGLIHVNGQASFILVIQKHPKLVTYKAQAYHIKCVYTTGEKNVTLGFNVSMLTTAGTIANTGPPPTCVMKIVTKQGQEIDSAEIGDDLVLKVDVQPASIYGGFARTCIAKTMEDNIENEYLVTDEDGCATDPTIFGEWAFDAEEQSLVATFNAFKFPSSDNIRFQCNIRVCFGRCQPVNCRGYDAFGRRKREAIDDTPRVGKNSTEVDVLESSYEGQLREEITIQSNAILTFERREERLIDPTEAPSTTEQEDICVSMIGFIIALVITALLALVAIAVAVSCWLMAYRRRPKVAGPLPHPPEFPNPLFTTPEPVAEPSPDYLS